MTLASNSDFVKFYPKIPRDIEHVHKDLLVVSKWMNDPSKLSCVNVERAIVEYIFFKSAS
mgnify:CR=1 FL=1